MTIRILAGDCREVMPTHGPFDMIMGDPPYGDTSLEWDRRVAGWLEVAHAALKPTGSMWVFGSMRFFLDMGPSFSAAGWKLAQDIVWEKQNGSGFHNDRFKRVHEHVVQFYRVGDRWTDVFNDVQKTNDATAKTVRRKLRPTHMGQIERGHYVSQDGGPRLMRSVIQIANCHGRAIHPTEKPVALLEVLIKTSCPTGGLIGDFFSGSGACAEAAAMLGRNYVGTEIDPVMSDLANNRIGRSLFVTD